MGDEIVLDLECFAAPGNGRGGQSARRDVEWNVPPMILERSQSHSRLAHDLRPHMDGVSGAFPFGVRKRRPIEGSHGSDHTVRGAAEVGHNRSLAVATQNWRLHLQPNHRGDEDAWRGGFSLAAVGGAKEPRGLKPTLQSS